MLFTAVIRLRKIPSQEPVTNPTAGYTKVTNSSADDFANYYVLNNGEMVKATGAYDAEAEYYTKD